MVLPPAPPQRVPLLARHALGARAVLVEGRQPRDLGAGRRRSVFGARPLRRYGGVAAGRVRGEEVEAEAWGEKNMSKKSKPKNCKKRQKYYWSQNAEMFHNLSLHYFLQMLFYKDLAISKKDQSSPLPTRTRTRTKSTVPWSGLRNVSTIILHTLGFPKIVIYLF